MKSNLKKRRKRVEQHKMLLLLYSPYQEKVTLKKELISKLKLQITYKVLMDKTILLPYLVA